MVKLQSKISLVNSYRVPVRQNFVTGWHQMPGIVNGAYAFVSNCNCIPYVKYTLFRTCSDASCCKLVATSLLSRKCKCKNAPSTSLQHSCHDQHGALPQWRNLSGLDVRAKAISTSKFGESYGTDLYKCTCLHAGRKLTCPVGHPML